MTLILKQTKVLSSDLNISVWGDYILMKNLYSLLILLIAAQLFSNELTWVDEQVEAIKPARIGVSQKEISKIKDPFISYIKMIAQNYQEQKKDIPCFLFKI